MKTHGADTGYSKLPICTAFQEKHMWLSPVMRQVVLFLSFCIIVYDFCRVEAGKIQEGALLLNAKNISHINSETEIFKSFMGSRF